MPAVVVLDPIEPTSGTYQKGLGRNTYWWETDIVCVPWVDSPNPHEFLHWLRLLEEIGKPVFFPTVINGRLARLLTLRGYVPAVTYDRQSHDVVDGLVKLP